MSCLTAISVFTCKNGGMSQHAVISEQLETVYYEYVSVAIMVSWSVLGYIIMSLCSGLAYFLSFMATKIMNGVTEFVIIQLLPPLIAEGNPCFL